MPERVLVVAAHPDDEVLGCGGTIARHAASGDAVHVAILAKGLASRGEPSPAEVAELCASAERAGAVLGTSSLQLHDNPDNRMDTVPALELAQSVEALLARFHPSIVYTHWAGDVNVDHRLVHQAVVTACRPLPGHSVERVLFFEVPSSTEWQTPGSAPAFAPNYFVDVTGTLEAKLAALSAYSSELREFPHPRSRRAVEYLARWRGATVGLDAAEAFVLGRQIRRGDR